MNHPAPNARARVRALAVVLCVASLATGAALAAESTDWPQFRGVDRSGISHGGGRVEWGETGPEVVWKHALGPAFSQPVVVGGALFTGTSDAETEYLVRLDAATGEEVWRVAIGAVFESEFGNGPRSTPTVVGDRVYILGGSGTVLAAKTADGAVAWRVDLAERFGAEVPRFGYSGAPLVEDDLVILEVGGGESGAIAAFDAGSGETTWTALSGPAGYASALPITLAGTRQILHTRGQTLHALDLEGNELWSHELPGPPIAMPVDAGDDRVFVSAQGDTGCVLLRVTRDDDGFAVDELWRNRNMRNHFNSSVVHAGHIYGFDNATFKCLSLETGEFVWGKRGLGKGSLLVHDDRLLILTDSGKLVVADASPAGWREIATFQALDGKTWTAPVVAGGRVYLRDLDEIACLSPSK